MNKFNYSYHENHEIYHNWKTMKVLPLYTYGNEKYQQIVNVLTKYFIYLLFWYPANVFTCDQGSIYHVRNTVHTKQIKFSIYVATTLNYYASLLVDMKKWSERFLLTL